MRQPLIIGNPYRDPYWNPPQAPTHHDEARAKHAPYQCVPVLVHVATLGAID